MRTLKPTLLAALALLLGASTASAASVDVIWRISGESHTTVTSSSVSITADIVMTIAVGDTGIGGSGAGIQLSADYGPNLSLTESSMATLVGWTPFDLGTDDGVGHFPKIIVEGDLEGLGAQLQPGSVTVLGTITVHVGAGPTHSVLVSTDLAGGGDKIIASTAVGDISGEFTFGAGTISHIPEPGFLPSLAAGIAFLAWAKRHRERCADPAGCRRRFDAGDAMGPIAR